MAALRLAVGALVLLPGACSTAPSFELLRDDEAGTMIVMRDGREVFAYRYHRSFALPHVHPLNSPTGRSLTVQHPDPYPHHRSVWIADRVQIEGGPDVDFYHCWKNLRDPEHPELGYHSFLRHDAITGENVEGDTAEFTAELTWIVEEDRPVLAETRSFRVRDLGGGEYLLDLQWQVRAGFGDVVFRSDDVHYAWPYLRMEPRFSGRAGGEIVDDAGNRGQAETDGKVARWIDYSNGVEGVIEGVAVFAPADGEPRTWLTREYGTFGPRRAAAVSGSGFTLRQGESLPGRAGILVHRGDAKTGRVADRYRAWVEGR